MKKYCILLLVGILIISCKSEFKSNELLIDFKVETKSPEKLYEIESFKEEDYLDVPREIKTEQIADILLVSFEVFEGNSTKLEGNIDFDQDTLILKIGKEFGIKELVIHEYQYKVLNPDKKKIEIKIENNIELEDL